jgi:hypothetical protein
MMVNRDAHFFFNAAATLVFFLLAANWVQLLGLAGVLHVVCRRFDFARHEAVNPLVHSAMN